MNGYEWFSVLFDILLPKSAISDGVLLNDDAWFQRGEGV